jgi:hypothetical protein
MRVVAAGVEATAAEATAVANRHGPPDASVAIAVGNTCPAAAIQHAVRHGMTVHTAGVLLIVCTVGDAIGAKRSREECSAVYVLIGPSMPGPSGDDGTNADVCHETSSNSELGPDRDSSHVNTKRHC